MKNSQRLPRITDYGAEITQQFITFDIRGVGFLLPIESIFKAIVFHNVDGPLQQIDFEGNILPAVNVDHQIFNRPGASQKPHSQQQLALLVQPQIGQPYAPEQLITLPIDSVPSLCRLTDSSLVPLPRIYQVKCVDGMTNHTADQPLRFLLNPLQLAASLP